ncbi:MAG TPA: hypothetical protein VGC15_05790 [Acetobacteraceae bacterium]
MAARVATTADLEAIIKAAKHSPGELERLVSNPEEVLADRDLTASPGAVEFLRSMGKATYDEAAEMEKAGKDALGTGAGET